MKKRLTPKNVDDVVAWFKAQYPGIDDFEIGVYLLTILLEKLSYGKQPTIREVKEKMKELYAINPNLGGKKDLEQSVQDVINEFDKLHQVYKRVNQTLKNVGYAPFDAVDNIEMFYTLQLTRDVLREVLGE